jgi:hypothetical protein
VSASAYDQVPPGTGGCQATPPRLSAAGSITSAKAETVTYFWALSDGRDSAPATVTFTGPGTLGVAPLSVTPAADPGSGDVVLVVTGPVATASSPAPYTLTCNAQKAPALAASAAVSPASQSLASCSGAPPAFTFTGTISDNKAGSVGYHWKLPNGNGPTQTATFARAGSRTVSATYEPASDSVSGAGTLVVTSPAGVTSNAAAFTLTCGKAAALTLTDHTASAATVGAAYSGTVTASGGQGGYAWDAVTGLPAGLKASASGPTLTISGTPTAAGTTTVALSVHDGATPRGTGTTSLTITVSQPEIDIISDAATTATVGKSYSGTATATGGDGSYAWDAVTGLPAGLKASASGATLTISGTPTKAGTATVTLTARDTESTPKTATTSLTITVSVPSVTVTTGSLPGGTAGKAYSATVTATGGTGTPRWSATGLPANLSIDPATGTIAGTPAAPGTYAVTVTVTAGTTASASLSIVIGPAATTSPSQKPSSPRPSESSSPALVIR